MEPYKTLNRNDVLCLGTLLTGCDREFHFLTVGESLEAIALDCAEVNEHIRAALLLNKAVAFRLIEPLNGASNLCHLKNTCVAELRPPLWGRVCDA